MFLLLVPFSTEFCLIFQHFSEGHSSSLKRGASTKSREPSKTIQEPKKEEKNKLDAAAKEEETLGNDSSLAHQSFIRTRFKQSRCILFSDTYINVKISIFFQAYL